MEICNRKIVFKSLVGSHNYNLNNKDSDKDYKIFVIPAFDDLYNNKMFVKNISQSAKDVEIHDIRKLPNLLYKSNVNYIEVLFSEELILNPNIKEKQLLGELIALRNEIAKINLSYLYKGCKGMYHNKIKHLKKLENLIRYANNIEQLIWKNACNAYRILDFIKRFYDTDFKNFKKAIYYKEGEKEKILNIKEGKYTKKEFQEMLKEKEEEFENLKEIYLKQQPNKKLYEEIINLTKKIVQANLF